MMQLFIISKSLQMITTVMLFFTKNYLKKFTPEFSHFLVTKNCKKMVSPWWSFRKLFDIINSCIIILFVDCNTHLHILTKKQKLFLNEITVSEKRGGAGHRGGGNGLFWSDKNFWPMGWPEVPKFDCMKKNSLLRPGSLMIILFESKTKNLCYFKVGQFEILKNMVARPLWNERYRNEHLYLGC